MNKKNILKVFITFAMIAIFCTPFYIQGAVIGDSLTTPEDGWKRYDNTDKLISYTGDWVTETTYPTLDYQGSDVYSMSDGSSITFKFKGTGIRLIGTFSYDHSDSNKLVIGSKNYTIKNSSTGGGNVNRCKLMAEVTNLNNTIHSVTISKSGGAYFNFDAVDIQNGELTSDSQENLLKMVLKENESQQMSLTYNLQKNLDVKWTSSDESIATVDKNGVITGKSSGTCTITASDDAGYKESINVFVVESDDKVLAVDLKVAQKRTFTIDDMKNETPVTWSSDDSTIASVDTKGEVSALKKGETYIHVKDTNNDEIGKVCIRVRES